MKYIIFYFCICYVQFEILYKLQLVQISSTSCNLYRFLIQVVTCTDRLVEVATYTGPVFTKGLNQVLGLTFV